MTASTTVPSPDVRVSITSPILDTGVLINALSPVVSFRTSAPLGWISTLMASSTS